MGEGGRTCAFVFVGISQAKKTRIREHFCHISHRIEAIVNMHAYNIATTQHHTIHTQNKQKSID